MVEVTVTVGVGVDIGEGPSPQVRPTVAWPSWEPPPSAVGEWLQLQAVLTVVEPPCRADPEAWFATRARPADAEVQAWAVASCAGCPALDPCRAYAVAAGERDGVWGGLSPSDRGWRG